jgi:hypothetical protein
MSYLDQYVDAVRFLGEFEPEFAARFDHAAIRKALDDFQSPIMKPEYATLVGRVIAPFGEIHVSKAPVDVERACHTVSHGFRENFKSLSVGGAFELAITVGNVFFREENIYNVTREEVRRQIHGGPRGGHDLPVHVWLTLEDMTVIDLTVLTTLRRKGIDISTPKGSVLVWRESDKSDFRFEPLLVDNLFATRVDNLSKTYRKN